MFSVRIVTKYGGRLYDIAKPYGDKFNTVSDLYDEIAALAMSEAYVDDQVRKNSIDIESCASIHDDCIYIGRTFETAWYRPDMYKLTDSKKVDE